jgi:hypothetical protein
LRGSARKPGLGFPGIVELYSSNREVARMNGGTITSRRSQVRHGIMRKAPLRPKRFIFPKGRDKIPNDR